VTLKYSLIFGFKLDVQLEAECKTELKADVQLQAKVNPNKSV